MISFKHGWDGRTQLGLFILLAVISTVFVVALPHLRVDRQSEFTYMGAPYKMLKAGQLDIADCDPFVENGPQAVFVSAAIAYYSHSLKAMRYYHFIYAAIMVAWLFWLLLRTNPGISRSWLLWSVSLLLLLAVWITIPLILVYPIQFNGMTPGFLCFLAGVILNAEHPYCAALLLGCAYSYKGQFLAMLPGWMIYKLFLENRLSSWKDRILHTGLCFLLFFVPTTIVITLIGWALHLFSSREELRLYAFRAPSILLSELSAIWRTLLHQPSADPDKAAQAIRIRHTEYAGFGWLTWSHIVFSMGFCLYAIIEPLGNQMKGRKTSIPSFLSLFGAAGLLYWFNYLVFWSFPFWYNTLPVIFFNIFAIPYAAFAVYQALSNRFSPRTGKIFLIVMAIVALRYFVKSVHRTPGWGDRSDGTSLEPYSWMSPS